MEIKAKVNKGNLIKLKRFCMTKEITNTVKRQHSEWEKIMANETTDKELISKLYISSSYSSISEKQTAQSKNRQKQTFSEEDI